MINAETITDLLKIYKDDVKYLNSIERCLLSFEDYHKEIFRLEVCMKIYTNMGSDKENYKNKIEDLDRSRRTHHNALLSNVKVLNRMAEINSLPPFYDGTVSEEKPYRREVANAVLQYVEEIIINRS